MALPTRKNPLSLLLASPLAMLWGGAIAWGQFPVATQTSAATPANCQMIQESGKTVGDHTYTVYHTGGGTPVTVYCDMTTDGGGWTLIGRGREGWVWSESGQSTGNVSTNIATTSAFTPSYFPSTTVDRIIRSVQAKDLPDGIRLKRAASTTGSTWQEVRLKLTSQSSWSWILSNETSGLATSWSSFDGVTYSGANNTHDGSFGGGDNNTRIFTFAWPSHSNQRGFSYGASVTNGTSTSTNYLWEAANEDSAIPFTEVYVRPRYGGTLAYSVPANTAGNQGTFTGSFGMDFNVGTSAIRVVAVGYFAPSDAAPPSGVTITVGIFNRATSTLVSGTQVAFTSTAAGTLLPGTAMRVRYLNPPVTLAASGQYSVVAQGYGTTYAFGNSFAAGTSFSTTNPGNSLISFVGTSRYSATTFSYPTTADIDVAQYRGGTFLFLGPQVSTPLWIRMPNTTNYAGAETLCTSYGRRLCYRSEYCPNGNAGGEPVYGGGKKAGDQWAPVKDLTNNWVQVGIGWPSCQLHTEVGGGAYGTPGWSTSTGALAFRNWVLCCL